MKLSWTRLFGIGLVCLAGWGACAATPPVPALPPVPPLGSPVDIFRVLLATNDAGRQALLAARSPDIQKAISKKLDEYLALALAQRELRLTLTELRWFLGPLLSMSPAVREAQVAKIPERLRAPILDRLKRWDALSPEARQKILQNEDALALLIRLERPGNSPAPPMPPMPQAPAPDQRREVDRAADAWRNLPAETRRSLTVRFDHFFDLDPQEQAKTLQRLPDAERPVAEQIVSALAKLSKLERESCLASFEKFAALSPLERRQFLDNAARWQSMSPEQRREIRTAVKLLPPMPPGLIVGTPPLAANPPAMFGN